MASPSTLTLPSICPAATDRTADGLSLLDRTGDGLCALPSCEEPHRLGDSWCSSTHYLIWLAEATSSLPDHICRLPNCTRPVFVDDNGRPSQFCGWRHCQKFAVLNALQRQEPLPSVEDHPQGSPSPARDRGIVPSLDSLMHSLKQFALFAIPVKNIRVLEDFYEKHPWEVFTAEEHACWLIVRLKITTKGRELTTKGHYHWKQSGPPAKKSNYTEKTYVYRKRKGKEVVADQHDAESSYSMKEYTMEDVKLYSLIKVSKGNRSSLGKCRRKQPIEEQDANVNHVLSQDIGASNLYLSDDDMDSILSKLAPLESIINGLPPLDNFMEDVSLEMVLQ